ncbi:hypothetical protein LACPH_002115 [Lacticaseibacillus parahuelsenbergensis]|uniref:Uncharacterized protein n=1 Tax=Lacticaseibacillus parahuelsenbergensis TaxID=3068305 RepID=A0ABY9L4I7_9LACO|nr:hypothetical protein [Lacticaseibacillus sp. NCIMB 15471]WLV77371.1 hypothetical protein LACPH_002115 [Lacticaseibacillus sp. NCIMB 15471]
MLETYKLWKEADGSRIGTQTAIFSAQNNIRTIHRSASLSNDAHILPQLTETAKQNMAEVRWEVAKDYGIVTAEEGRKKYIDQNIDDSVSNSMLRHIHGFGNQLVFQSAIKVSKDKGEDKAISTISGE